MLDYSTGNSLAREPDPRKENPAVLFDARDAMWYDNGVTFK